MDLHPARQLGSSSKAATYDQDTQEEEDEGQGGHEEGQWGVADKAAGGEWGGPAANHPLLSSIVICCNFATLAIIFCVFYYGRDKHMASV